MNKKVRTAAIAAATAVAGTTLALTGGLPAAADNNEAPSTEWCNDVTDDERFHSGDHTRAHIDYTEHMGDTMGHDIGMGMDWGFDEMGPDDDMGRGFDQMGPDDTMGRGNSQSMDRGRGMGR